jgi:SAM-dependent methyltransferase
MPQPSVNLRTRLWVFARLAYFLLRFSLAARRWPDADLQLRAVYWACFKRELDDEQGRPHFAPRLRSGELNVWRLTNLLLTTPEFQAVRDLPRHPLMSMHYSRIQAVKTCLPPAETVIDLGGVAIGENLGALLKMGYPYRPREVFIVDLPPDRRMFGSDNVEAGPEFITPDNVRVKYIYGSMTDLSMFSDACTDLVYSGESIEHVSEAEADRVCQEVHRVLRPGGYFCLDTPNAALTRLQSPDAFIHPEHKKEYTVPELRRKLERWGFDVVDEKALVPMPESLRRRVFDVREQAQNTGLSDEAGTGYLFFLKARKAAG